MRDTEAETHRGIRHLDFAAYAFPFGRAVALLPLDLVLWIALLNIPCEQSCGEWTRERIRESAEVLNSFDLIITTSTSDSECVSV